MCEQQAKEDTWGRGGRRRASSSQRVRVNHEESARGVGVPVDSISPPVGTGEGVLSGLCELRRRLRDNLAISIGVQDPDSLVLGRQRRESGPAGEKRSRVQAKCGHQLSSRHSREFPAIGDEVGTASHQGPWEEARPLWRLHKSLLSRQQVFRPCEITAIRSA